MQVKPFRSESSQINFSYLFLLVNLHGESDLALNFSP